MNGPIATTAPSVNIYRPSLPIEEKSSPFHPEMSSKAEHTKEEMTIAKKHPFTRHLLVSSAVLIYVTHNGYLIIDPFNSLITKKVIYSFHVHCM